MLFRSEARVVASENGEAVALIVRVSTGKIEPEPLYSFLAEMTAIIAAIPGQQNLRPSDFASAQGLATLYPFLREAVANLTARGRFGPVYLLPFNFTAAAISREAPVRAAAVAEGADIAAVEATKKRRAIGVRRIGRK